MERSETTGDPDSELVRRFQAGDRAAFGPLVDRYVRLAGAVAYSILGNYEQAADAVQDGFLKAHGALPGLRERDRFKPWLAGVVRSCALDALRRRKRGPGSLGAVEGADDLLPARGAPVGDGAEQDELRRGVLDAVDELPEQYREVVVMKYVSGASYEEISAALGLTVETIESRLFRARKLLKDKLGRFAEHGGRS